MPLYEFVCSKCDLQFEELVFGKESVECPKCQNQEVERQMSLPARPQQSLSTVPTNCAGDGPPCGAPWCGRKPD